MSTLIEGFERRTAFGINVQVPRSERVETHLRLPAGMQPSDRRHNGLLNGSVEPLAIGRRVVKAVLRLMRVVTVIGEACIARDLRPHRVHPVEQIGKRVVLLHICLRAEPEGPLAHCPIRTLQERLQARNRQFFAVPIDGQAAGDLVVLAVQFRLLLHQRHVLLAEEIALIAQPAQCGREIIAVIAEIEQAAGQPHLLLADAWADFAREAQVRCFLQGIRGVRRIRDAGKRGRLAQRRFEV